jgi:CDP-diacylglycerol--glycerol-3-phosphate 3-phosphatidyltransferase
MQSRCAADKRRFGRRRNRVTLYALKPAFQSLLRPCVGRLARSGVTANQVTLAGAVGSIAVGIVIAALSPARWPYLLVPFWLFLRMALNAIDGMLARDHGQRSRIGAYLNELSDVVSDTALYAPFALLAPFGPYWTGVVVLLAILTEFAGVLGPAVGATRRYDGPVGKSDRALAFGALGLWIGLGGPLPEWSVLIMVALAGLLVLTVANRIRAGLAEAEAKP